MTDFIKTPPRANKTLNSLRHLTYTNETAIADLVDNSIDAGAKKIEVSITEQEITILDDGCGMTKDEIAEALTLGSDSDKDTLDLGRFGMGLVTASISIGRRVEVASSKHDTNFDVPMLALDLDVIKEKNDWVLEDLGFNGVGDRGTVVTISKIDNYKYRNIDTLVSKVKSHLGETFRRFIMAGRVKIFVNDEEIEAIDPLRRDAKDTVVLCDQTLSIVGDNDLSIIVSEVERDSYATGDKQKSGLREQGFYIVRNNRQIARAVTIGGFHKHPITNHFRCEVRFDGTLDKKFGINFTKNEIVIEQALADKITEITNVAKNIIANSSRARVADKRADEDMEHTDSESIVKKNSKVFFDKKEWSKNHKVTDQTPKPKPNPNPNPNPNPKPRIRYNGLSVTFEHANLTASGNLYDCLPDGNNIIIRWNTAHPFYEKLVAPYNKEKDVSTPLDLLIFSMAYSELSAPDDATVTESLLAFREKTSHVLRALMS